MRRLSLTNLTALGFGLAFLYAPIAILVVYSFNASRLVTVWGGWSIRWYLALLEDRAMIDAAFTSLGIALVSAALATVLGTMAALALTRLARFRGRFAFAAMIYAPLVMPEVITGLSLLLLFVAIDLDRGFFTVTIAHTTLTMCFVTVIVQARLAGFDRSLEEAAMDLGCPPGRTFLAITLPLIMPGVIAGFLLAFSLSLDDLVIASFTTGPGATTLPIRIYSEVRLGVKPEINAICTILIAVVAVAVVAASLIGKGGEQGRGAYESEPMREIRKSLPALAGRTEQVGEAPHRDDDRRTEHDVGQDPRDGMAQKCFDRLRTKVQFPQQHMPGDAEMREDRAYDHRGDRHCHDGTQEAVKHRCPCRRGRRLRAGGQPPDTRARSKS